jgi:hypothetical protein
MRQDSRLYKLAYGCIEYCRRHLQQFSNRYSSHTSISAEQDPLPHPNSEFPTSLRDILEDIASVERTHGMYGLRISLVPGAGDLRTEEVAELAGAIVYRAAEISDMANVPHIPALHPSQK